MRFSVRVHPHAVQQKLFKDANNNLLVYLTERPEKDKANKALIELLAKQFAVAKSRVKIIQGRKSKFKVIEIEKVKHE